MNDPNPPLSQHLRDPATEVLLQAGWQGLEARRRGKVRSRRPAWVVAGALALGAAGFLFWPSSPSVAPALTLADGQALAPSVSDADHPHLVLSDDSRLALGPGTQLELAENRPGQLHLLLRQGRLELDVRSHGQTRWRIDCGSTSIEVVGTRFTVERQDDRTQVTVAEGKVRVSDPNLVPPVQYLGPGEKLSLGTPPGPERSRGGAIGPEAQGTTKARQTSRARPTPAPEIEVRSPSTLGQGSNAEPLLPPTAPPKVTPENSGPLDPRPAEEPDVLLRQADEARRRGDHAAAVAALAWVAEGSDARAALAALTMGRLLLDELADPNAADRALVRALELPLPPAMSEIAWARRVEAQARMGAAAQAKVLADEYRSRFPNGRFTTDVERWSPR